MNEIYKLSMVLAATDNFSEPVAKAAKATEALTDKISKLEKVSNFGLKMSAGGALMQGAASTMTGALGKVIKPAIEFESVLADIAKVVDFDTPQQFAQMGEDIQNLSARIPMATRGLGEIMAAAGQAGIAKNELLRFTEDAAKMGVAFDMAGAEAGAAMTGLRSIFQLNQDGVVALADSYNYLSNTMDARASDLLNFANRTGGVGKLVGLTGQQIGAAGATFAALKTPVEVGATAFNSMLMTLGTVDKKGPAVDKALHKIGLSSKQMAKMMKTDAQGALLAFLEAAKGSPDSMGLLVDVFGAGMADQAVKLVEGLDIYKDALGKVADQSKYAGSMEKEYAARAATTENNLVLLSNQMNSLYISVGSLVLPTINQMVKSGGAMINGVRDMVKGSPELVRWVLKIGAGLALFLAVMAPLLIVMGSLITSLVTIASALKVFGTAALAAGGKLTTFAVWCYGAIGRLSLFIGRLWAASVALVKQFGTALLLSNPRLALFATSVKAAAACVGGKLIGGLRAATIAVRTFGIALMANPIGLIIGLIMALAFAVYAIYDNWDGIVAWFTGKLDKVTSAFDEGFLQGLMTLFMEFNPFLILLETANGLIDYLFGIDLKAWLMDQVSGLADAMPDWMKDLVGIDTTVTATAAAAATTAQSASTAEQMADTVAGGAAAAPVIPLAATAGDIVAKANRPPTGLGQDNAMGSSSGGVTVNFSPQINLTGVDPNQIKEALRGMETELMSMIKQAQDRAARRAF